MKNKIDVLNREKEIQDLKKILLMLSENKRGCVFAIDGGWGYGKTYILEKLEAELEVLVNEETANDRYYVFHYNCWQYDYYEEPAIAIVSSMLEKMGNEIDEKVKGTVKDSWKYAEKILKEIAGDFVKNKIGIDLVNVYGEIQKNAEQRTEKTYDFDDLFSFKKTLDITRKKIKELAEEKTVVLVVDELDRCMPSYAIKVLERLHHLFDGIDNVIVLLAIDSTQLEHSIQEIYGDNIDTERYLKKFISFSVKLNIGELQMSIFEKYSYYFQHFSNGQDVIPEMLSLVNLCEIDIRNLDKLIEKLNLVHEIVCKKETSASVLLFEVIWGMMKYKTKDSFNKGISTKLYQNFSWIPEIDKSKQRELGSCIGNKVEEHLKDLKAAATTNAIVNGMNASLKVVKKDLNGITWYILDQIFATTKTFYLDDELPYQEMIDICKSFNEMANILW